MKILIKSTRIELDGDYKGGWVDIRTNPPAGELLDFITAIQKATDEDDMVALLPSIYGTLEMVLQAWNFTNAKDKDISCDLKGLKSLPIDLLTLLTTKVQEAIAGLPLESSAK